MNRTGATPGCTTLCASKNTARQQADEEAAEAHSAGHAEPPDHAERLGPGAVRNAGRL